MENERLIGWEVPGVGRVDVVASYTDGLSKEEIQKRWDSFQRTANRLRRDVAARRAKAES